MGNSLRDELLKVGLVSEEQAREASRGKKSTKARSERRAAKRAKRRRGGGNGAKRDTESAAQPAPSRHELRENQRRAARIARDASLSASAGVRSAEKERRERVRALLEEHALSDERQDIPYHFVRGKRIRRIYVSAAQRAGILAGDIVVVAVDGAHHLLGTGAAQALLEIAPNAFVASVSANLDAGAGEDDHPVPDDISW